MAREPIQKIIDGVKYTFGRHMPKTSRRLFNRIMKIIAPTIASSVEKESINDLIWEGLKDTDFTIDCASGVKVLCSLTDEPEVEAIFDIILGEVIHNGNSDQKPMGNCRDNYDAVFLDASIPHVYKVVFAALEVEYQNFFGKGVDLGAMWDKAKDLIPGK
jgi:hypothetical protein